MCVLKGAMQMTMMTLTKREGKGDGVKAHLASLCILFLLHSNALPFPLLRLILLRLSSVLTRHHMLSLTSQSARLQPFNCDQSHSHS